MSVAAVVGSPGQKARIGCATKYESVLPLYGFSLSGQKLHCGVHAEDDEGGVANVQLPVALKRFIVSLLSSVGKLVPGAGAAASGATARLERQSPTMIAGFGGLALPLFCAT